jgi:hypothetical protein
MFGAIPALSVSSPVKWDGKMGTILVNNVRVLEDIDCSDSAPGTMLWIFSPVDGTLSNVQLILSGSLSETNSTPRILGNGNTYQFTTSYTPDLANLDAEVQFTGTDSQDTKLKISHGCTGGQNIPEFPTVALPIAAVIGLVFFFQHKKKKEE